MADSLNTITAAGAFLVASTAAYLLGFVVLLMRGRLAGLASTFSGVEGIGDAAIAQRIIEPYLRVGMLFVVIGFALLSAHLVELGEPVFGIAALPLLVIGSVLMVIEGSFHSSVTVWAGKRWAETKSVPELYEPVRRWLNKSLQTAAMIFVMAATGFYGWGLLDANIGLTWIAWAAIGWSGLWLGLLLIGFRSLPAIVLIMPTLIGIGLLLT